MSCSDLNLLDTYASDTVTRAHAKHVNKMEKCEKVAMIVPEESIVSGTSRRVESCFSELKALKRSTSKIKARRIFVFAISKFNNMIKWLYTLPEERQIEFIELALIERAENERVSKQLMTDDLRKLFGIVADNQEILYAQELV
ncbi:unnamed protein product [Oikopleura dioica]|uniref:Uncharacterized protein n=1 Tax=Oikopleura dioica TaxID=34765 RepID=E4XY71_OIKDI|nr:unnamed protein product [Oikopleura dioica]